MVNIYQEELLEKNISSWDKVIKLKKLYKSEISSMKKALLNADMGAAKIAECFESAVDGERVIDEFIDKAKNSDLEGKLKTAFSMVFDYQIKSELYLHLKKDDFRDKYQENDNKERAMQDVLQLLAYGEFGKCDKCNKNYDIRGMWAKGIWRGLDGKPFENPTKADLEVNGYCYCPSESWKKIDIGESFQKMYFTKFKKWRKKIQNQVELSSK